MASRLTALTALALLAAAPVSAKPLTVRMGETWIFSVERGQPVKARKATPQSAPAHGEIKISVQPLMGTTMTVTNNSRFDYSYRAMFIQPDGTVGLSKTCAVPAHGKPAMEHWARRVAAVRLSNFRPAAAGSLCP